MPTAAITPDRVDTLTRASGVSPWLSSHFFDPAGEHAYAVSFDGTIYDTDLRTFVTRELGQLRSPSEIAAHSRTALRPMYGRRGRIEWPASQPECAISATLLVARDALRWVAQQTTVIDGTRVDRVSLHALDGALLQSLASSTNAPVAELVWARAFLDRTGFELLLPNDTLVSEHDADGTRVDSPPALVALRRTYRQRAFFFSRTVEASIDGDQLVLHDHGTGARRSAVLPLREGESAVAIRPLSNDALCVWLARTENGPAESSLVLDRATLTATRVDGARTPLAADERSLLYAAVRSSRDAYNRESDLSLVDRRTGAEQRTRVGPYTRVALTPRSIALAHDGQYSAIPREAFAFELRAGSEMGSIETLLVSDDGAVCAQDIHQQIRWWNRDLSLACSAERAQLDPAIARDALLGWADGQSTLVVRRTLGSATAIVGLASVSGVLVERWSLAVDPFERAAFDDEAMVFVTALMPRTSVLHHYDRRASAPLRSRLGPLEPVRELHWMSGGWIDARATRRRMLVALIDERLQLVESVEAPEARYNRVAIHCPGPLASLPTVALEGVTLRPHDGDDPSPFATRTSPHHALATASYSVDKRPARARSPKHLWIDADPLDNERVSAVAFSRNGRWGAIGTNLGRLQRFALPDRSVER